MYVPASSLQDEEEIKRQIISCEIQLLTEVAYISVASIKCFVFNFFI